MQREINLEEISDGRLYDCNDMVKADCNDCQGCSDCCRGMGTSVILDPLDVHRLCVNLGQPMELLLQNYLELNLVDGVILPNLKMVGEGECCGFLNKKGRCGIHGFRPGICRLFPLGRFYEDRSYRYFLQVHECRQEPKTKVKVRKWLDTPDFKRYEQFIADWHYFLKDLEKLEQKEQDAELPKKISLYVLRNFYLTPYQKEDFYSQFYQRLEEAKSIFQ